MSSAASHSDVKDPSTVERGHTTSDEERVTYNSAPLESVEDTRPPYLLTSTEIKLLSIAGVGFFLDAYDLFIINPVATMLQYRLYDGKALPTDLEGFIKAGANIGSVIGQFGFGFAADYFGRKAVYGKELMTIIVATILSLGMPTGTLSPRGALIYLGVMRILLGIGVGGDYPMSASVASDRTNLRKRGTMLAYIFSAQGWGSFGGSLVTLIVLAAYKSHMGTGTKGTDGIWRIAVALSLIPAFGTLYQRLTMPESKRFLASRKLGNSGTDDASLEKNQEDIIAELKQAGNQTQDTSRRAAVPGSESPEAMAKNRAHVKEFLEYFGQWRHGKHLLGTCACWFLLDVAFYGINLNQNVVLQQIGFDGKNGSTPWERLFRISTGNIIITVLGFVPGYYATVLTIETLGRKKIQLMGFLMAALFLAILAGCFHTLSKPAFIVCFTFLQFFFNFGANSTTYVYPAEIFPTRFKAFAHGISAAAGKCGAILSAFAFNKLSKEIGTPKVLWIFFACCIAGAGFTLLLPESRQRDADILLAEEIRVTRAQGKSLAGVDRPVSESN